MQIKTKALKDAGIKVITPSPELKAGLAKVGDTITAEWVKSAGRWRRYPRGVQEVTWFSLPRLRGRVGGGGRGSLARSQ